MSKSVVEATRYDIDVVIELLRHYADSNPVGALKAHKNEVHVRQLITALIMGAGKIWIGYRDELPVGMLIAARNPNVWNPDLIYLQELAWWVEPQHRNSMLGARLLYAFRDYAMAEVDAGRIAGYTISKMVSSPDLDYSRLGMNKLEETWIGQ